MEPHLPLGASIGLKYVPFFFNGPLAQPISQARLGIPGPPRLLRFLGATWIP